MKFKKIQCLLLASIMTGLMIATPVCAAPEDDKKNDLEAQKSATQSEVAALQDELNTLMTKMNDLEIQLIDKGQAITQAETDLEASEEKEKQQYEDMKVRIKYMYEEGDSSALERIFSSGSIGEMLAQAEYVQKVHTYDREQLQEYANTVQQISDLKTSLEADMEKLQSLETEYQEQSVTLNTTIDSKRDEVANLDVMIQEAAQAAIEAAAKRAAEEAAAAAAAAAANNNNNTVASADASSNSGNDYVADSDNGGGSYDDSNDGGSYDNSWVEPAAPSVNTNIPSPDGSIVDRAYSYVGNAEYVWGACSPGAFDCSGFVSYCLTGQYARLGTTYTFLTWQQVSDPQPGDVCVNADHCGIYVGGGQMVHAATFGVGVIVGPVQSGMIYVRY